MPSSAISNQMRSCLCDHFDSHTLALLRVKGLESENLLDERCSGSAIAAHRAAEASSPKLLTGK